MEAIDLETPYYMPPSRRHTSWDSAREDPMDTPPPDPFTFKAFDIHSLGLWRVVHHTLNCAKAERMQMMLREEDHLEAFVTASKTTDLILDDFMARWTENFGDENESFARFIAGIMLPVEAMLKRCRDLQAAAADRV
jgi:hypothetical protein